VLATQNPIEQEGTYPLPEAPLDRVRFDIRIGYPTKDEEIGVLHATTAIDHTELLPVFDAEETLGLQNVVIGAAPLHSGHTKRVPARSPTHIWTAFSSGRSSTRSTSHGSLSPRIVALSARSSTVNLSRERSAMLIHPLDSRKSHKRYRPVHEDRFCRRGRDFSVHGS
jgi:MoxR-like ATPase